MTQSTCPFGPGYDFTDPDVLLKGIPVTEFAELRKTAPVWWNEQSESIFDDGGYWVISRHEDIKAISRNGDLWSTNRKGAVMRLPDGVTADQLDLTKALLINHDAPEHTRLRKIVSRLFTPRAVATLEEKLAVAAREIVARRSREGQRQLRRRHRDGPAAAGHRRPDRRARGRPREVVPLDQRDHEHRRPGLRRPTTIAANAELMGYAYNMAEERRRCPADDIVTRLIAGRLSRRRESIGDVEFAFFVILLAVAGNETTRNAMTHGMNAFFENPDQWELFKRERPETAVDEIIRWATPVHCFQRTALADTELGGVTIARGSAGRPVLQLGQLRRGRSSTAPSSSTSCATPIRTWRSAATARTSASAPTWPAWRSS